MTDKVEEVVQETKTDDVTGSEKSEKTTEIRFDAEQQKHVDSIVADRLKRAKASWEADSKTAQQKAAEKAEQERLTSQQEFKTLAEKAQAKLTEIEPQLKTASEQVERYKTALEKQLTALREGLSKPIIALLDRMDVADQLEWLAENGNQVGIKAKGPDPTPKPNGDAQLTDEQRRQKAAQVRNYW